MKTVQLSRHTQRRPRLYDISLEQGLEALRDADKVAPTIKRTLECVQEDGAVVSQGHIRGGRVAAGGRDCDSKAEEV